MKTQEKLLPFQCAWRPTHKCKTSAVCRGSKAACANQLQTATQALQKGEDVQLGSDRKKMFFCQWQKIRKPQSTTKKKGFNDFIDFFLNLVKALCYKHSPAGRVERRGDVPSRADPSKGDSRGTSRVKKEICVHINQQISVFLALSS